MIDSAPDGKSTELLEIHHDAREPWRWVRQWVVEGVADLLFQNEVEVEDVDRLLRLALEVLFESGAGYLSLAIVATHSRVCVQ